MPELPEVETITNRLRPYLLGKKLTEITSFHPKSFIGNVEDILHKEITAVERRGKMIRIKLENGLNLITHLKMTGQLILIDKSKKKRVGGGHPTSDWLDLLPTKHTRIKYLIDGEMEMYFNDQRLFGWMKVLSDDQVQKEFAKLGPDATALEFTFEYFKDTLKKRSIPIKQAIMDNKVVSGVGNIYAADSLNLAQISPFTLAKNLNEEQLQKLYKSIRQIIHKGIYLGGATTDGKYINVDGMAGKYQLEARVYDRKGKHCLHCGGEILKTKLGGRGTYYCGTCQT